MRTRPITAAILTAFTLHVMLVGCKKPEPTNARTAPEQHQQEMLTKSFDASKKAIAARVNGEAITEFSLLREMNSIAPQYLRGTTATPEQNAKIRNDALNTLVIQTLAIQEAKNRGIKITPEVIDAELTNIKKKAGSETAYKEYLTHNGFTESELRETIAQDYLFERIAADEIDAKIQVTDAALKQRYQKERGGLKDAAHGQMTFETARSLLEQKIKAEAGEKRMREWEKEMKKNARIEIIGKKESSF